MANITLLGASYTDVPAIDLPQTGGGTVRFYENGGGSVTVEDEPNATGTTCVITTGGEPTPTPSGDIPLNTELVDYTAVTVGKYVDESNGTIVNGESWDCVTDYLPIDPSMTFTFVSKAWYGIGFYNANKTPIRGYTANDLGTVQNNYVHGTITPSVIPSNAVYCVLTGNPYALTSTYLSLIRTA